MFGKEKGWKQKQNKEKNLFFLLLELLLERKNGKRQF
jgi:hypothetical protein